MITVNAIFIQEHPKEQFPDADGAILLFRKNGDCLSRIEGRWKMLSRAVPPAVTIVRTTLTALVSRRITYPTPCTVAPSVNPRAWLSTDETRDVGVTITNKDYLGFDVVSRFDCIFEFTYGEPKII